MSVHHFQIHVNMYVQTMKEVMSAHVILDTHWIMTAILVMVCMCIQSILTAAESIHDHDCIQLIICCIIIV